MHCLPAETPTLLNRTQKYDACRSRAVLHVPPPRLGDLRRLMSYREVKEEEEGVTFDRDRFIKGIRIKRGEYYIANSEVIGDVFEDNDEVICEIFGRKKKKEIKAEKFKKKQEEAKKAEVS
ncbi:unnamed protein product [Sphagnum balticum]